MRGAAALPAVLYPVLRWVAAVALRWFYRDIAVTGVERIPARGPVLLAGNHSNALVDALVIGTETPRRVVLTAKSTIFANPLLAWFLAAVGVVPLRRADDARQSGPPGEPTGARPGARPDPARNAESFRQLLDVLGRGGVVLLFPEGRSHSDPSLAPLKSGLARIALEARDGRGITNLAIVCVGLTFERKDQPRSRVLVEFGEPLFVDAAYAEGAAGVAALTGAITHRLRRVTLNFPTRNDAVRVLGVSRFLSGLLDRVRPLADSRPPLPDVVRLARRLEAIRRALPSLDAAWRARATHFLARLDALCAAVDALGVAPNELGISLSVAAGARYVVRETVIALAVLPIALWGRVNHWVPLRLAQRIGRRQVSEADQPAMYTIVSGLALVLVFYGLQAALVGALAGPRWVLVYLLSLPPSATWDLRYRDRARAAWRRMRTYVAFRRDPSARDRLLAEAEWLRTEAESLAGEPALLAAGAAPDVVEGRPV